MHYEHVTMLDYCKQGVMGMREWQANRSNYGSFRRTVIPLLKAASDPANNDMLGFRNVSHPPVDIECKEQWFLDELQNLKTLRVFCAGLGADMIWLDSPFTCVFPFKLAIMHHKQEGARKAGCHLMRKLAESVEAAEEAVKQDPVANDSLKKLLEKGYFIGEQFPRECMCDGNKENWSHESQSLKDVASTMTDGPPTTADALEKTFAYIQNLVKLNQKSKAMSAITLWYYLNTSPYAQSGGLPMLETTLDDYKAALGVMKDLYNESQQAISMKMRLGC